jgi:hypothetical protein
MESNHEAEISTREIDAAIAAALGVSFRWKTRFEKALPREYPPKPAPRLPTCPHHGAVEPGDCLDCALAECCEPIE